jgi:hypothetical protein
MDTEKKTAQDPKQNKQPISDMFGDMVVSAATVLAHSAAEAAVDHVKKAVKKSAVAKKAKTAAKKPAPKSTKRKAARKARSSAGRKAVGRKRSSKRVMKAPKNRKTSSKGR